MKQTLLAFLLTILLAAPVLAQDNKPDSVKKFMQITTVESVISGGLGRSRMIITQADGTQKEVELNNLFSIAGINFKNISQNEQTILQTLKSYTDEGWKLEQVSPLSLSPGSNSSGIFMTRYLLSQVEQKK